MSDPTLKRDIEHIKRKLDTIEDGIRRNDNHITFVSRLYFAIRNPLLKLLGKIGLSSHEIMDTEEPLLRIDN
jgi:hypothetical protein